ncbi:ubiquitin-like protein, partial [Legionella quateirensis]
LKEGIPIQDQILIYSAKTLEDNQLIKDYGINGSIHLVQKLKQHQQTETPTQDELTRHLYITTIAGKKITIDYNPKTDTIAHLKNEIFRKEGIPIEDQLLTIAGQELIDSRLIEEYEAQKIESIRLLSSAQNQATEATSEKKSAQLQIQTLTGTEFLIEYNPETDTIAHLKSEIFRKAGIPIEEQALLFAGKKLIDSQLIKEYNINHIVRLVQKLKQHEQTETPTQDELTSQLFIKTLEGITIPIKCKPNTDTIADLKRE